MISKRARYALHGVGFLAYRYQDSPISFAEILECLKGHSGNLSFSSGYISKIFQELCRAGITTAVVGRKGGYALARRPRDVRILDVVEAMDGYRMKDFCLVSVVGGCRNQHTCGVRKVILGAEKAFYNSLAKETAESLSKKMFSGRGTRKTARATRKKARTARSR